MPPSVIMVQVLYEEQVYLTQVQVKCNLSTWWMCPFHPIILKSLKWPFHTLNIGKTKCPATMQNNTKLGCPQKVNWPWPCTCSTVKLTFAHSQFTHIHSKIVHIYALKCSGPHSTFTQILKEKPQTHMASCFWQTVSKGRIMIICLTCVWQSREHLFFQLVLFC